jgi:hypothetical protein
VPLIPAYKVGIRGTIGTKITFPGSPRMCGELHIADLIIIKKGYPKPSSYSDSIYKLGDYGLYPKSSPIDSYILLGSEISWP